MGVDVRQVPRAPGRLPLLGHALPLWRSTLPFLQGLREHGDMVRVDLGTLPVYFVTTHALAQEVLAGKGRSFDKGRLFTRARTLVGNGLMTAPNETHRRHRRLMQPMFHHARIAGYADTMAGHARRMAAAWRPGEVVPVDQECYRYAIETLTDSLFASAISPDKAAQLGRDLPVVVHYTLLRALMPKALDRLPIRMNREYDAACARMQGLIDDLIANARRSGNDEGSDLLSTLLAARDADTGETLTDVEVRDEVVTILIAGCETSASTMAWLFHELARAPEVEKRLGEEIDTVVGDGPVRYEHIPELGYLEQVMDEVLRLHAVPMLMRRTVEEVEIGGVVLPAETEVGLSLYALHQDPRVYRDPGRFDPDRWTPELRAARRRGEFVPFGSGRRMCIGDAYARMEIAVATATILQRWRLRPAAGHQVREVAAAIAHPDHLPMTPVPRDEA
jgi:cytochrome P450